MIGTEEGPQPLTSRAAVSVGWMTAQTWVAKIGGFLTVMLLARLLTPDDFGVVAVAMTVLPVVYLLSDLGFAAFLMQTPTLSARTTSTAFWYCASSGVVLTGALILLAPALADLFAMPELAGVIVAFSPAVLLVSLAAVPMALLRRHLQFRQLAIQAAIAAIAGQVVAIAIALAGGGVWALVAQVCVAQAIALAGAWLTARWRPSREFGWRTFGEMAAFGTKVLGVNGIAMARGWGETAVISNGLGGTALGQLSIAQRLVQTVQELAGSAITPVSTVVFARVREEPERLRRGYDRSLSLTYVLIAPALTMVMVGAPALVPLLFGDQWTESIVVAQLLAAAAVFTMGAVLDHGLLYGLGRPGVWLVYAAAIDALTVAATVVMARFGIAGVALGFVAVAAVATMVRWVMVSRMLRTGVWRVARRTVGALVAVGVSGLAGFGVMALTQPLGQIVSLAAAGVVVLTVQIALARLLFPGALTDLREQIGQRLRLPRARR